MQGGEPALMTCYVTLRTTGTAAFAAAISDVEAKKLIENWSARRRGDPAAGAVVILNGDPRLHVALDDIVAISSGTTPP